MAQNVIRKAFDPLAAALVSSASAPAEHGKVYVCGSTEHGAAGHTGPAAAPAKSHSRKHLHEEHHAPLRTPHLLTTLVETQVAQVSCGWRHSVLVLSDGELYACGDNEYGKCGFGDTAARPEPTRVPIPLQVGAPPSHVVRVATVSCGRSHSAFVCTVGELYTFGLGLYGQLGHRTLTAQTTPRRVDGLGGPVVSVSCGGLHTLLVRADGRALSCGFNDSGRLGRPLGGEVPPPPRSPPPPPRSPPTAGSPPRARSPPPPPRSPPPPPRSPPATVSAMGWFGFGVGATAEERKVPPPPPRSSAPPPGSPPPTGAVAGAPAECYARFEAVIFGGVPSSTDAFAVVAVAAGGAHSSLVLADGAVYTCGRGECGQLGHAAVHAEHTPRRIHALKGHRIRRAAAGEAHSLFLTAQGVPYACGSGGFGRLGLGGRANVLSPVPVGSLSAHVVVQISAGEAHSAFVTESGVVFTCGDDGLGACGMHGGGAAATVTQSVLLPQTPPKFTREGVHVLGASCGGAHTAFVLRTVIDPKEDYREDQVAMAATVIESFFRGTHVRAVREAAAARKAKKRNLTVATIFQSRRDASIRLIQSQWRIGLRLRAAERNAQLERMRNMGFGPGKDPPGWGAAKTQLSAALVGTAFIAAAEGANVTKPSWN